MALHSWSEYLTPEEIERKKNYFREHPEKIEHMKQFLRENPIDRQYDEGCELFDWNEHMEQVLSREYYVDLEELGELPDDIPRINTQN